MCIYTAGGGLCVVGQCLLVLVTVGPAYTGYIAELPEREETYRLAPHFDSGQPTDVRVVMGQPALLPCLVSDLGNKLVSWVRNRDLNILTSGKTTFTADPRFDIQHQAETGAWTLKIRATRLNDTGRYECQVNTDPKMSLFFNLDVEEHATPALRARISGPKNQYVMEGTTVTFVCEVEGAKPISSRTAVHWLHNGLAVSFQASRGGISMDTTRSERRITSRLTVAGVGPEDAGKYGCDADEAADALYLHVSRDGEGYGEHMVMEAMQRDQAASNSRQYIRCDIGVLIFYAALVALTSHCLSTPA